MHSVVRIGDGVQSSPGTGGAQSANPMQWPRGLALQSACDRQLTPGEFSSSGQSTLNAGRPHCRMTMSRLAASGLRA
jgi:hypothetical protein